MKLLSLSAKHYRSLRDESVGLGDPNLFIGANASGKSTILDAPPKDRMDTVTREGWVWFRQASPDGRG